MVSTNQNELSYLSLYPDGGSYEDDSIFVNENIWTISDAL